MWRQILRKAAGLIVAIVAVACLAAPAFAANINLGTAGSYSAFILHDLGVRYNQSSGSYAVGGDASMQSYTVGKGAGKSDTTLVVGGNLKSNIDPVQTGNIVVGGKASLPRWVDRGHVKEGVRDLPVDFNAEGKYLKDLSQTLSLLQATGSVEYKYGGVGLYGDGTSQLQVFNISGEDLSKSTWWQALSSIPDDAHILLNISGTDVGLTGGQQALVDFSDKVLFNFYQAEQLAIKNITVEGSILAAYSSVLTSGATIDGTIVAKSIGGSFSTTGQLFTPYHGGGTAAPEPGTMLLVGSSLAGLWGWRFRRRKGRRQVT